MSSQSTSPPETPHTPPQTAQAAQPAQPEFRLIFPTPPSFSAHRARSKSVAPSLPDGGDEQDDALSAISPKGTHKKRWSVSAFASLSSAPASASVAATATNNDEQRSVRKDRRVSFSQDLFKDTDNQVSLNDRDDEDVRSPKSPIYTIPQRQSFSSNDGTLPALPKNEDHPDRPKATPSRRPLSYQGPLPTPASPSRLASTAAARGLSIAPSLAKGGAFGSIWSAGIVTGSGTGWISPGLASARSTGTTTSAGGANKRRGLSVAVIRDGGEVIHVSPTLGSAGIKSPGLKTFESRQGLARPRTPQASDSAKSDLLKKREIILCKFHHTPGLTCTSRPCRFVHNLDAINLRSPVPATGQPILSAHGLLSPTSQPDPTKGTFAHAQAISPEPEPAGTRTKTLRLRDGVDLEALDMGEKVVVEDEDGREVVGHIFLMSGGGSGPGRKSKDKYKTVACKDFAEGHCPYGDYCSFIHEVEKPLKAESKPVREETTDHEKSAEQRPKRIIHRKSSSLSSSLNAWVKALPKTILVPSVKIDTTVFDKSKDRLSAFAPPFTKANLQVDTTGAIVTASDPANDTALLSPIAGIGEVAIGQKDDADPQATMLTPTTPSPVSAWANGPPAGLRRVSSLKKNMSTEGNIKRPAQLDVEAQLKTPTSATHLIPPTSAVSFFGTESDPATPFDPITHRRRVQQLEDEARSRAAISTGVNQLPRSNLHNIAFDSIDAEAQGRTPLGSPREASFSYDQAFSPIQVKYNTPAYPWGMPMSPVNSIDPSLPKIQGGLGVMWTPAGWAVQDAAMRHALRSAEKQTKYQDAKCRKPKNYFRTRPCKFFAEGSCPHGDECTYLHVIPVASPSSTSGSSSDTESLIVSPAVRQFDPAKLRSIPCKFFNSVAGCTNGATCNFLHTRVVPDSAPLVERPRPWRTKPCRHYQVGRCTLGDACRFAHVPDPAWLASGMSVGVSASMTKAQNADGSWKNGREACEAWSKTGRCAEGNECQFRHVGEGGEGNLERLTEEGLEKVIEEMRSEVEDSLRDLDDDEEEEDDDVEIELIQAGHWVQVTQGITPRLSVLAPSLMPA